MLHYSPAEPSEVRKKMSEGEPSYPKLTICEECYLKEYRSTAYVRCYPRRRTRNSESQHGADDVCGVCGSPIEVGDEHDRSGRKNLRERRANEDYSNSQGAFVMKWLAIVIVGGIFIYLWFVSKNSTSNSVESQIDLLREIKNLRNTYKNQNSLFWNNVVKMTNSTEPLVHTLILLYKGGDSGAAECIAKDLAKLINKIHNRPGDISIYDETNELSHYGEQLVKYQGIVGESRHLVVTNLSRMPGETAKIFHTLCDESTRVKPSYFIFTLEEMTDDNGAQRKNLATKAGSALRKAWSNLQGSDLHPLLSRIVRNVVEISSETIRC